MKIFWIVLLSTAAGFCGGFCQSSWFNTKQRTLRAESVELRDQRGNVIFLGPGQRGSILRFLDTAGGVRAEISVDDGQSNLQLTSRNQSFKADLSTSDHWPFFLMSQDGSARLGFGLQPDDTGSTSQEQWVFYSGVGGIDGARAILGSGKSYGSQDKLIRGTIAACCEGGNFWTAPTRKSSGVK
jgi:hypothetical protein